MKKYNCYTADDVTFVICTYKECVYLEKAIQSLKQQTLKANIIISTSTPNQYVRQLAEKYDIEVKVNPDQGQIKDYNFAIAQANTKLVMLMHQDEILHKTFLEKSINALNAAKNPTISFTNYAEMHHDIIDQKSSGLVRIKRVLLFPAKWNWLMGTTAGKRLIQMFGNPITHPSVICVKEKLPEIVFREEYTASMDWDLWERLSKIKGSFVYIPDILLFHRMNDDNQTAKLIRSSNARIDNEYDIFCRFWPKWIAKIINKSFSKAEKYY